MDIASRALQRTVATNTDLSSAQMTTVKASATKALEAKDKVRSSDAYNNFLDYKRNALDPLLNDMNPGLNVSFTCYFCVHMLVQIIKADWWTKIGAGNRFDTLLGDMAVVTDAGNKMFAADSKEV